MSTMIDDGGSTFAMPVSHVPVTGVHTWNNAQLGMSLRNYFAAHAPTQIGDDTDPKWISGRTGIALPQASGDDVAWAKFWAACEAKLRFEYADAMIAASKAQP